MYVAVLAFDKMRAQQIGEKILDTCLSNGCYSTFLSFRADREFLDELERREFNTVVITAYGNEELKLAKSILSKQPQAKLVLLGSDTAAVEGYSLKAHYCSKHDPETEDLERIAKVIFPTLEAI